MQTRSMKLALFLLLIVICLSGALPVWAQSTSTGSVAGTITDPSGAVVSGATVTMTDPTTNIVRTATTNATGRYFFADVTPGTYNISVSKAGFSTVKTEHQVVQIGLALTVNLALQVGGANVVVEVSAVGNELQTMNATVGNTVTPGCHRQPAQHWPRCQYLHRIAAGRKRRWRRCGRGQRPKLFLAGWRQQQQRYGWQRRRVHVDATGSGDR